MKYFSILLAFVLVSLVNCKKGFSEEEKVKLKTTSLQYFEEFQQALQKELKSAIAQSGPVGAIETCKTISPKIEKELSEKYKIVLKRISDKPRNSEHLADQWEMDTMKNFIQFQKEGKEIPVITFSDENSYRIMKAIPISNAMCLQCHGSDSDISAETLSKLKETYPSDQATGYSMGEIRGSFSAIWRKN